MVHRTTVRLNVISRVLLQAKMKPADDQGVVNDDFILDPNSEPKTVATGWPDDQDGTYQLPTASDELSRQRCRAPAEKVAPISISTQIDFPTVPCVE